MSELYTFEHKECGTSLVMATTKDAENPRSFVK